MRTRRSSEPVPRLQISTAIEDMKPDLHFVAELTGTGRSPFR